MVGHRRLAACLSTNACLHAKSPVLAQWPSFLHKTPGGHGGLICAARTGGFHLQGPLVATRMQALACLGAGICQQGPGSSTYHALPGCCVLLQGAVQGLRQRTPSLHSTARMSRSMLHGAALLCHVLRQGLVMSCQPHCPCT